MQKTINLISSRNYDLCLWRATRQNEGQQSIYGTTYLRWMMYWFPRMNKQYWLKAGAEAAETSSRMNDRGCRSDGGELLYKSKKNQEVLCLKCKLTVESIQQPTWFYSLFSHLHFALVTICTFVTTGKSNILHVLMLFIRTTTCHMPQTN